MRKFIAADVGSLVDFIAQRLALSKKEAKRLIDSRSVFVNGLRVWIGKHRLMIDDRVEVITNSPTSTIREAQPQEISILYQGGDALVIDKPPGIECVNGKSHVELRLRATWPNARVVHRLDRDTSGCLLATTSEAAWEFFIDQFKAQSIKKRYLALLNGELRSKRVVVDSKLDGKSATSIFHRRASSGGFTLCEIELLTGRTHQIRRHANEIACSLLGDKQYGKQSVVKNLRAVPRQMLHAWRIRFMPAITSEEITVAAPVPDDFVNWQHRLRLLEQSEE